MFETVKIPSQAARCDRFEHRKSAIDTDLRRAFNEILHEPVPLKLKNLLRREADRRKNSERPGEIIARPAVRMPTFGNG